MIIKCYDTFEKKYVNVEVEDEIGQFIKRSYWREDMQERRYLKRKVEINEAVEMSYKLDYTSMVDLIIKEEELEYLRTAMRFLDARELLIIYYVYYEQLTLKATADKIGVSTSHMGRLMKKIIHKLGDKYNTLSFSGES